MMTPTTKLAASELPESVRQRIQALSAAGDPLAIEGEDARILGYIVSPEQLQRLLEDASTERLLDDVNAVVQEVRADRAAENARQREQREQHEHERQNS
jgi:ATP/maltotriose-dependent transcriptional regulator MalT